MNQQTAMIRNKSIQLSLPYEAPASEMVGRDEEVLAVLAAWMGGPGRVPLSPLLVGDAGLGKNRIVYECARLCGKELYIVQCHEDVTPEDLVCSVRFSDDAKKQMDYLASSLVTAMVRGGVCFLDEIDKMRQRALVLLISLLDERRYIDSVVLGERIVAHPGFRFIAAANNADFVSSPVLKCIDTRLRPVIPIGYPERDEIDRIIRTRFERIRDDGVELLDRFWALWRQSRQERPPTPRDSIQIFGYALNLADFEAIRESRPYNLEYRGDATEVQPRHLERAFEVFRQKTGRENHGRSTRHDQILRG